MTTSATVASKLLALTKEFVDVCLVEAKNLKFDKQHPQQLYSICTYGSLLELASGIVLHAEAKQTICIPILMRSFLDAFATFGCCIKDPNHFKAMYASFTKEKLRLLDAATENPANPYLAGLAASMDAASEKSRLTKELADIKGQGYRPLKPWEEFQKADLSAEYQSLYWQLCLHAHN
ncbi:MAG TPA: DUF5677 domain-containing protein, partial [Steroidobacteraceae bacterium]|nr:DUF5677 domain-containing protein [Steroidobacteraceae bacterium]